MRKMISSKEENGLYLIQLKRCLTTKKDSAKKQERLTVRVCMRDLERKWGRLRKCEWVRDCESLWEWSKVRERKKKKVKQRTTVFITVDASMLQRHSMSATNSLRFTSKDPFNADFCVENGFSEIALKYQTTHFRHEISLSNRFS